jgi:hypothetical protein
MFKKIIIKWRNYKKFINKRSVKIRKCGEYRLRDKILIIWEINIKFGIISVIVEISNVIISKNNRCIVIEYRQIKKIK